MIDAVPGATDAAVTAAEVATAAQLACLLEASAPKPGNVSPGHDFADLRYEDFLASAAAIGAPLAEAGTRPLGVTIRRAIEATARWSRTNTNLGVVLLLAPIARAALAGNGDGGLRASLRRALEAATVDDAREVYAAIRVARPGGLGTVEDQDIDGEPTQTLVSVMRLAAERDAIAREYSTAFELTFATGAPALQRARRDRLDWNDAIVETFLRLLSTTPDTHIVRRGGAAMAADVSRQAGAALAAGGVRSAGGREAIARLDLALRDSHHLGNPGTTADLTAAALFVVLLGGAWRNGDGSRAGQGDSDAASR